MLGSCFIKWFVNNSKVELWWQFRAYQCIQRQDGFVLFRVHCISSALLTLNPTKSFCSLFGVVDHVWVLGLFFFLLIFGIFFPWATQNYQQTDVSVFDFFNIKYALNNRSPIVSLGACELHTPTSRFLFLNLLFMYLTAFFLISLENLCEKTYTPTLERDRSQICSPTFYSFRAV